LDTPGPIARDVEDVAILYRVLQGSDPFDQKTIGHDYLDPMAQLKRGVRGLHLAQIPEVEREGVAPEVLNAYDATLERFRELGAHITSVRLPCRFEDYMALQSCIMLPEAYSLLCELVENPEHPLDKDVRARVLVGAKISTQQYLSALREREQQKEAFKIALADYDALLTPTTETAAIELESVDQKHSPARFTRAANLLDLCALTLPNGHTGEGLPTSLQIICRAYDEATLLRIGWTYQAATGWHERVPPRVGTETETPDRRHNYSIV
jgi:aspartyl-tRNA(Asn)/glutamyl-tRNA(Gln) amidotransferase subunit A